MYRLKEGKEVSGGKEERRFEGHVEISVNVGSKIKFLKFLTRDGC